MAELAHHNLDIKRVAILFAGGPAPAANAVISTAAFSFPRRGRRRSLASSTATADLAEYTAAGPLREGDDYMRFTHDTLTHSREAVEAS